MRTVAEIFEDAKKKQQQTELGTAPSAPGNTVAEIFAAAKERKQPVSAPKVKTVVSDAYTQKLQELSGGYDPVKNREAGQAGWNAYVDHGKKLAENTQEPEEKPLWERLLGYLGDAGPDTSLPVNVNTNQIAEGYQEQDRKMKTPDERWTEEQRYTFGYLWNTKRQKAYEYAYAVNDMLNTKAEEEQRQKLQQEATDNFGTGAAHTAGAILSAPAGGLAETLGDMIAYGALGYLPGSDGETSLHEYSEAVKSGVSSHLNDKGGTINEAVPIIGGKGWGDVYSLGTSIAQSLLSAHTGGQAQALITAFGTAVASGIDDAKARGAEDSKAIGYGVLTGTAEAFAEMIGVDNLLKIGAADSMKAVLKNILKQGAAESLEEGITSILNNFADNLVLADKSNLNIAINDYMAGGMSREDAQKQAWLDMAGDVAFDMLGGFISGNVSGGVETVIQTAGQKLSPTTSQQAPNTLQNSDNAQETAAEAQPGSLEYVQRINDLGKGANTTKQTAFDTYEDILARGTNAAADPLSTAVEALKESGTVTNKQATEILNNSKALQTLREQVGLELPDTASGRRAAIKEAVARLAEAETQNFERRGITQQRNDQLNIDNAGTIAYNNTTNGGEQNERTASTGEDQGGISGVYEGRGTNDPGRRESGGASVSSGLVLLRPSSRNLLSQRGVVNVELHESSADNAAFSAALDNARATDAIHGWAVTPKGSEELDGGNIRTFMDDNASTGFAIAPDGDIEAVFANKAAGAPKGSTKITIPVAIANGGTKLDCYGEGLVRLYAKYGFVPVARTAFNPEYANEGWTPDKGTPDIYFMMHNGDSADTVVQNYGTYPIPTKAELDALPVMEYDEAYAYRDNLMREKAKRGTQNNTAVGADESVGAAPSGFDPNSHLQYQYGTLPSGENPVRSDDLPVSTDGSNRVSQTAVTVKGAKVTPDDLADLLDKDVTTADGMTYIPITNDATVQKAFDHITEEGWEAAKAKWHADVRNGKAGADLTATGALLLNNAAKAGDKTAWLDILHDYQLLGTNTAQGLQAFRILKKLTPSDKLYMAKRTVNRMVKDMNLDTDVAIDPELEAEYTNAETDEQRDAVLKKIQKNVAQQLPTTFMEKFTALRYVNMLGNLRTQGRNIVGNLTMMGTRAIHNAVATGIEAVASKVSGGKVGRTRSLTVNKGQMAAGAKDFVTLQEIVLDGGKYSDNMTSTGFARGVQEQKKIFKNKALEGYRKVTNWAMEQGDIIFAKHAYARALAGYLKANGITETDFSKVDTNVMDDARLFAAKEAQEATFRDTNWLSGWVSKIGRRKDTPAVGKLLAEGIMPFRKTPANVLVRAEEYSPLGVINSIVTSVRAAQKDSDVTATQVINSWAKTLTGTGIFGMGMLLQSLGMLSTGPDEDEKKDGFEDLNGWQDYALTLPDGTNLTIDSFSPSAIPMLMGAQFMQLINDNGFQLKDVEAALTSIADPLVEMSMLQGVNDSLENIQYADSNLGQFAINAAVSYLTQGLTNTLAGQIERSFEDSRMQTYVDKDGDMPAWLQRTLGKASAKTPGWDYSQIPYINAWGEEEENPSTALNLVYNLLSPSYFDKGRDDDLTRELNRLNDAQSENVYPSTPDKTVTINKQAYNLSAEEYVSVAKLRGQTQKQLVEDIVSSSDYAQLSDEEKAKAIRYAYEYASGSALGEVIEEHPGITTKWLNELEGDVAEGIIRHVATGTTTKYTYLSVEDASYVTELLDGLYAETGRTNVRDIQRIEAIVGADDQLTQAQQKQVLKDTLTEYAYDKYLSVLKLGMDNDDYAATYRTYLDEKETGGKGTKARIVAAFCEELRVSERVAEQLYDIYAGKK